MTIGTSIALIAAGAILRWAVTAHVSGFDIQTAGTVLFALGIVALVLSLIYTFAYSRGTATTTYVPPDQRETRRY
jgi:Zn-dependent protease with chaperone function